jgi:hypothetical protein
MSEIIKFPFSGSSTPAGNADSPAEPITDAEFEKVHSAAFRDLEPLICDCVCMAKIAADAVMSIRTEDSEAVFAVAHAYKMLAALKKDYYAMWRGVVGVADR